MHTLNTNIVNSKCPAPLIDVQICNTPAQALLDTGSNISLLGNKFIHIIDSLNLKIQETSRTIKLASGNCISKACISLNVKFQGGTRRTTFVLLPELPIDVLLGRDFIYATEIVPHLYLSGWTMGQGKQRVIPFAKYLPPVNRTPITPRTLMNNEWSQSMSLSVFEPPQRIDEVMLTELRPETDFDVLNLIPDALDLSQRKQISDLLLEFNCAFSRIPGNCKLYEHTIETGNALPKKCNIRPMTPGKRKIFEETFDELLELDIIEPASSPWAASPFVKQKPDGSYRGLVNYKPLNSVTVPDCYPMPNLDDTLCQLSEAKYFTTFDLSKGFHQITIAKKDRHKTAFNTPRGSYQFKRLAMGLCNSPATFQKCMDEVLADLKWKCSMVYYDDVMVYSKTFKEHMQHVRLVLERLTRARLTINPKKVQLCRQKLKYLGFIIEPGKCFADPAKIEIIKNYPQPKKAKHIQRFMGLVGFYRRFIDGFTQMSKPLTSLNKKDAEFVWTDVQQKSFDYFRQALCILPGLHLPNLNKPFAIHTDASKYSISAILNQYENGVMYPVWYASKALNPAEIKYSNPEKECLAVIWAIKKFRGFIEYNKFTIETDHEALKWLTNNKDPSGRLAHWFMELQGFNFDVKFRRGSRNQAADALSRVLDCNYVFLVHQLTRSLMIEEQMKDIHLTEIIQHLKSPDPNAEPAIMRHARKSFITDDGLLMRYVGPRDKLWDEENYWRVWVPFSLRNEIMGTFHSELTAGHLGIRKTYKRLEDRVYWPNLRRSVSDFVKSCVPCQTCKVDHASKPAMSSSFHPERVWDVLAIDLMGPYTSGVKQSKYLLTVVDQFSKYVEIVPLRTATAKIIVEKLWDILCHWGLVRCIITDNGTQFTSTIFLDWCKSLGIENFHISAYHPQANICERYNQTIKSCIVTTITRCKDWDLHLSELAFAIRTAVSDSTTFTPAYLMTGREYRTPFDNFMQLDLSSPKNPFNIGKRLHLVHEIATQEMHLSQEKSLAYLNRKSVHKTFEIGDKVLLKTHFLSDASKGFTASLAPKREGPYTIIAKVSKAVFDLECDQTQQKVNKVHINELKPFFSSKRQNAAAPNDGTNFAMAIPTTKSIRDVLCA